MRDHITQIRFLPPPPTPRPSETAQAWSCAHRLRSKLYQPVQLSIVLCWCSLNAQRESFHSDTKVLFHLYWHLPVSTAVAECNDLVKREIDFNQKKEKRKGGAVNTQPPWEWCQGGRKSIQKRQTTVKPTDSLNPLSLTRLVLQTGGDHCVRLVVCSQSRRTSYSAILLLFSLFHSQNFIAFWEEINSGSTACQHRLYPEGTEEVCEYEEVCMRVCVYVFVWY